ncbi:MAG: nucleotidyltransferase domain-containing protein [Bacteroidales bacterium]|nr:nucleotidyltransferase domain-containing protein [Bacteroidales bacterium]
MKNIPEKTQYLHKICKKYNIIKLYLFGSFAKNTSTEGSDIDFLVTFGDVDLYNYFDNFLNVKNELEKLYERTVDLVEEKTIKN